MPSKFVLDIAERIRTDLAGSALLPLQAKLYSQRVRRDMGAEGLPSFSSAELNARLDEACLLLEAGWLERSNDSGGAWIAAVKRSAEILEWISHAALKPSGAPIHLLSASAYQVAGYPAMALGHLRLMPPGEAFSVILREFLRGDFDATLSEVQKFWKAQHDLDAERDLAAWLAEEEDDERLVDLEVTTVRHVIMCIGTICSYLRTGDDALVERALIKLDALARSYLHSRDPYSYLLARLCAGAAHRFIDASLWPHIEHLTNDGNSRAREALTQFARALPEPLGELAGVAFGGGGRGERRRSDRQGSARLDVDHGLRDRDPSAGRPHGVGGVDAGFAFRLVGHRGVHPRWRC